MYFGQKRTNSPILPGIGVVLKSFPSKTNTLQCDIKEFCSENPLSRTTERKDGI